MKTIKIDPVGINNFHNRGPIAVRVSGETVLNYEEPDHVCYRISKRQARRIEKHFCGIYDCRCPSGGVVIDLDPEGKEWGLKGERKKEGK